MSLESPVLTDGFFTTVPHGKPKVLVAAYGIKFPDQGSNLGPLHWEHEILATRKVPDNLVNVKQYLNLT